MPATAATLRVLIEKDETGQYVAQCVETGNVAVADDYRTVRGMIIEILQEEFSFAEKHNNFENLYSSPAPPEIKERFQNLPQDKIETLELFPEVHAAVELANAA